MTLRHKAQSLLISERSGNNTKSGDKNQGVFVFNTLPWVRSDIIVSPEKGTKWSNQQWDGEYEYLLGKHKYHIYQYLRSLILFFIVENIPGLGASGFIENTNDFKSVPSEKTAKGKLLF